MKCNIGQIIRKRICTLKKILYTNGREKNGLAINYIIVATITKESNLLCYTDVVRILLELRLKKKIKDSDAVNFGHE